MRFGMKILMIYTAIEENADTSITAILMIRACFIWLVTASAEQIPRT
jgi:hypothetical protein